MITTILFDLDGTLLPMDQGLFVRSYVKRMASYMAMHGYDRKEFTQAIIKSTGKMIHNDGSCTNEDVFWTHFCEVFGETVLKDKPLFEEFYRTEFQNVAEDCGHTPEAGKLIQLLKAEGFRLVLATNPIFPAIATESRMRWAGVDPSDFEFYTTYENSSFCKPNLKYYQGVLDSIGCQAEECVMVGNDIRDDMVAEALGIKGFLLTNWLIERENTDISSYPNGGFDALRNYLLNLK